MHLLTPYSKRIFLDTDIVYKPITFRIDEYFLVRKHCLTGSVKKNEWMQVRVCIHLFERTQTKHVTRNTVHGNVH